VRGLTPPRENILRRNIRVRSKTLKGPFFFIFRQLVSRFMNLAGIWQAAATIFCGSLVQYN
jgi:hypothetical protein